MNKITMEVTEDIKRYNPHIPVWYIRLISFSDLIIDTIRYSIKYRGFVNVKYKQRIELIDDKDLV